MTIEEEQVINLELARSHRDANRVTRHAVPFHGTEPDLAELASWADAYWYTAQNALEVYARNMRKEADFCDQQGIGPAARAFREAAAKADEAAATLAQVMEGPDDPE